MMRAGIANVAPIGLERLYMRYGVDLVITGHTHNYERFLPMYENEVRVSDAAQPYHNPRAQINVVNGGAGNSEKNTNFAAIPHPASAFRSTDYGFARLVAHNATHIYWDYFSGSADVRSTANRNKEIYRYDYTRMRSKTCVFYNASKLTF